MSESEKRDWHELAAAVASENDPKKLELLLQELIRALDDRQSQSHVAMRQTATTNRWSAIK
jgi:hypothetical protein